MLVACCLRLAEKAVSPMCPQEAATSVEIRRSLVLELPRTAVQVSAIDTCLREPVGRGQCSLIQGDFGEEPSSGPFGKFFGGK